MAIRKRRGQQPSNAGRNLLVVMLIIIATMIYAATVELEPTTTVVQKTVQHNATE